MFPHLSKRILVTGASRGIGYAIAHRFASLGASILLVSRSPECLDAARSSLPMIPGTTQKHTSIPGDVGSSDLWDRIRRTEKDIDILINAAGIAQSTLLLVTPVPTIDNLLRTNLLGTTLACRAVARGMVRRGAGCIINVSSLLALQHSAAGASVYAATKAGVVGLTRALAVELGPRGVRTNVIVPGYIETDMTAGMTGAAREGALARTPLGRYGSVAEVAEVAVFLVANEFMNGAEVVVDGGLGCN